MSLQTGVSSNRVKGAVDRCNGKQRENARNDHKRDSFDKKSDKMKKKKKKSNRPIASGRISTRAGCIFAAFLSIISIVMSYCCWIFPASREAQPFDDVSTA